MRHLTFFALFLVAACGPADPESPKNDPPAEEAIDPAAQQAWAAREALQAEVPELAACNEAMKEDGSTIHLEPIRHDGGNVTLIEVPCGGTEGSGAYGYPLTLIAEYPAMNSASDGPLDRFITAIPIVERTEGGTFEETGFVTQAKVDTRDLDRGYIHLFYPAGAAGSCGLLVTYEQVSYRSPFQFFGEARERSCGEPCEGEVCSDPRTWDRVVDGLTPEQREW